MNINREMVVVFVLFLALAALMSCRGCTVNEQVAIKALETSGFSDIKIVDHSWFAIGVRGGGSRDAARFTAEATNPVGKRVTVEVFTGWLFKGATIRSQ